MSEPDGDNLLADQQITPGKAALVIVVWSIVGACFGVGLWAAFCWLLEWVAP